MSETTTTEPRRICFYHRADLDGHCSGALVKLRYRTVELVGIDYADGATAETLIRDHSIDENTEVIMVDFSLQPFSEMMILKAAARDLIWCDHHQTAIKAYDDYVNCHIELMSDPSNHNRFFLAIEYAGCELTWLKFYDGPIPKFVHLLGRYDIWDHKDPDVVPFQYGIRAHETNPSKLTWNSRTANIWHKLYYEHSDVANGRESPSLHILVITRAGKSILTYIEKDNKGLAESSYFLVDIIDPTGDNLHCVAINKLGGNSQVFDSIWNTEVYDAMILFGFYGKMWRNSIYTTKEINVGDIAKRLGGGGHAKAARWDTKELPFIIVGETSAGRKIARIIIPS